MAFPTTNATQEIDAINQILATVGQAPVTTLDKTNPDVAIAYDTLLQVSREVQAEGWTFNKEYDWPMSPDDNNEIAIPDNMLQIDLHEREQNYKEYDVVRRDGKLYDRIKHTNKWTSGEMKCDVVWHFDWVDLPIPIQDYITARAASFTVSRIVGDPQLLNATQQKEAYCRALALEYECNQGQYTFFGHPKGGNHYTSYQPYKALQR
tara:strand:- start:1247 stop:1867 length:621 start_codon:yes stop_codon:yes gene_type:complete